MKYHLIFLSCFGAIFAVETTIQTEKLEKKDNEEFSTQDIKLLSQAYGHMIGQNLSSIDLDLDSSAIISGIQDAFNGMESPLSEAKTIEMLTSLQEKKFKNECEANLKAAEAFLAANKKNEAICELEGGKLQYKKLAEGTGKVCSENQNPVISYVGTYLNGEVFGKSEKDETISLDETIEGFKKAIIGMKVGEKRVVYIHPELGYGINSSLSPNALLTFEIEMKGLEDKISVRNTIPTSQGEFPSEDAFADSSLKPVNVK
jgi:peptidylprolyl isomerase